MTSAFTFVESRAASDAATRRMAEVTTRRGVASPRVEEIISGQKCAPSKPKGGSVVQFASWNVRSLLNSSGSLATASARGKTSDDRRIDVVVDELGRLGIEAAGLQETRWFGQAAYDVGDSVVLASGRSLPQTGDPSRRGEGVAIVLRKRALRAWRAGGEQWKPVSSRLAVAELRMVSRKKFFTIHIIACYAPTFRSSRNDKDTFFNDLQAVLRSLPRHDKFVLLGDFNARVGTRSRSGGSDAWEDVRGPRGFGECNDAGKELLSFLSLNTATICNTWFEKKPMQQQTWQHPKTKDWHAIDFIIVHQRDRYLCQDCRVICSADCGSDHRLVCISLALPHTRFDHHRSPPKRPRFDVSGLRPPLDSVDSVDGTGASQEQRKAFQAAIASELESRRISVEETDLTVESHWALLRDSIVQAGEKHLGQSRRHQPDWYVDSQDVLSPLIELRRKSYNCWVTSQLPDDCSRFKIARSKARAAIRRAKNDWLSVMAERAERHSNGAAVWKSIRSIQQCFRGLRPMDSANLKDEFDQPCKSADTINARWHQHFTKILNIESSFDSSVFDSVRTRPVREDLAVVPTGEDLARAIGHLANNKAAGQSGILPEMVRHAGTAFSSELLALIRRAWAEGCVPQEWCDAELVPIPKKGDLSRCDNWRGIALLDVVGKVVGRIIQTRMQEFAEGEVADSQCGFRKGRSCTDHIFSISQVVEKCFEHRTSAYLVFIDLRKAYDSVSRPALWRGLQLLGVPPVLIQLIASFHHGMIAKVRVGGSHTKEIPVNNGLRQGCSMSPVLFNLFFELVLERFRSEMERVCPDHKVEFKFKINGNLYNGPRATQTLPSEVPDLEFADDAVLIVPSHNVAQLALATFAATASSFGLAVNFAKTKIMPCGVGLPPIQDPVFIDGSSVEFVDSFVYLGSEVSPDSRCSGEVDRRLASAARAFGALQCVFQDRDLSIKTKRLIYSACVLSSLLYGAECWPILRKDERRLDVFHHRCLRSILGVSRWNQQLKHITNADLRLRWGDPGEVSDVVRKRRLQWLGHVARMNDDRLPKQLLFGWFHQRRPAHGPRFRWKDRITADLKKLGVEAWYQNAQDRTRWKQVSRSLPIPQAAFCGVFCDLCSRSFKSKSGFARHKCRAERELPVEDQCGARTCRECQRWFRSAGGLRVHKCIKICRKTPLKDHSRSADSHLACCQFHCSDCRRCFKSRPGFNRHNCKRGKSQRPTSSERDGFQHQCRSCERRFRRQSDLNRHRCKLC